MLRRTGLDAAACFPSSHAESNSALRAYVSSLGGNIVACSATSENSPAKQTAAMRKKCIPNQATYTRFEIMFLQKTFGGKPNIAVHKTASPETFGTGELIRYLASSLKGRGNEFQIF